MTQSGKLLIICFLFGDEGDHTIGLSYFLVHNANGVYQ